MDKMHRQIRAELRGMAPRRAVEFVMSFDLPDEEAVCVIECDVRQKSYTQLAQQLFVSPELIKRRRRSAYHKIADAMRH